MRTDNSQGRADIIWQVPRRQASLGRRGGVDENVPASQNYTASRKALSYANLIFPEFPLQRGISPSHVYPQLPTALESELSEMGAELECGKQAVWSNTLRSRKSMGTELLRGQASTIGERGSQRQGSQRRNRSGGTFRSKQGGKPDSSRWIWGSWW
jgi:hypothetical protein